MNRGRCSRFLGQKISWAKESLEERLTPPAHRPVTRQRTRPHSKPRRQRRRNSMQRTAALAATFLRRFFHTHPVPARGALRIQTLHGPSWKLHCTSRRAKFGPLRKKGNLRAASPKKNNAPKNWRDCAPMPLVCQEKCPRLVVVHFQLKFLRKWIASKGGLEIYGRFF
jgi:hypothetical protein